jgi:hypothetical protein
MKKPEHSPQEEKLINSKLFLALTRSYAEKLTMKFRRFEN